MKKILLISHFGLAEGLKNTLSYFNEEYSTEVTAINAYANNCFPQEELEKFMNNIVENETVLIFTDILGGSVNQLCIPYLKQKGVYVFTGMNLGMVLQAMCLSGDETSDEIKSIVTVGRNSVICMNDYDFSSFSDNDE